MGDPEKVVTEAGGVRLRSAFEIVEEEPGVLSVSIEGPTIEFDDEEEI